MAARERTLVPPHSSPFVPCVPEVQVVVSPRILGEGHTGQAVCETAGNTEFRVCSWGLRFDVAAEDSEL